MNWKQIFVVELNADIVATGALANFGSSEDPKYTVSNVFVRIDMQYQGIGVYLMRHLLNSAREKGIKLLHVPSSKNAISFYQNIGFIKDEIQPDYADEITWMIKAL